MCGMIAQVHGQNNLAETLHFVNESFITEEMCRRVIRDVVR